MTYREICSRLEPRYGRGEAQALTRMLLEVGFGMDFADVVCGNMPQLSPEEEYKLDFMCGQLKQGRPIQYVLGKTEFCGNIFHVSEACLIPRPETEELCRWIIENGGGENILDIGTGSGCIAITLSLAMVGSRVEAWDISADALAMAWLNADNLHADILFERNDILNYTNNDYNRWDIIVSNPPYICEGEKKDMDSNVLNHEPGIALFVPDENPLLFYRAIARYGRTSLKRGGKLYFEINPIYADDVVAMMEEECFHVVEVRLDQFGKKRFVRGEI